MLFYQLLRVLQLKVPPLVCDLPVGFGYGSPGFLTAVRAAFLAGKGLLELLKSLLCAVVVPGGLNERCVRERSKVGHTQVYSYLTRDFRQRFRLLHLTREDGIPPACLILDGTGFHRPFDGTMQRDLDGADFREAKPVIAGE